MINLPGMMMFATPECQTHCAQNGNVKAVQGMLYKIRYHGAHDEITSITINYDVIYA